MSIKKRIPRHSTDSTGIGWLMCLLLFLAPLGYMLLSLGLFDQLTRNSYEALLEWYGRRYPTAFDGKTLSQLSYREAWHIWEVDHHVVMNMMLITMPVLYLAFSRSIWQFFRRLVQEMGRALVFLRGGLRGSSPTEKGGFFLLMAGVLAYRLYFYFANPMQTDELCSYLYFARPGFLLSITSYPIPNNHVLFNAFCSLLNLVPGLSMKAVMRLPSIVGDMVFLYSIFCLVRRWDGYVRAMVSVAAVAFCYVTSYYAVQGRGYQWQEICALVSAVGCWKCFLGPDRGSRWGYALFIAGSVAGLYINPVFVYHVTALALVCLWAGVRRRDWAGLIFLGKCFGGMAVWLVVVYMPLVLCSSWKALVGNEYVTGGSFHDLWVHKRDFAYIFKDMVHFDMPGVFLLVLCVAGFWYAYRRKVLVGGFYDMMSQYLLGLAGSMIWWIMYTRLYPPERGLCYVVPVINLVFINACYDLFRVYFGRAGYWVLAVLMVLKIGGSMRGLYRDKSDLEHRSDVMIFRTVEKDIKALDALRPIVWQIMACDDFYPMYIQDYLIRKGGEQRVVFNGTAAEGDVIFVPEKRALAVPADRYVLWADNKLCSFGYGGKMKIYVARRLVR